MKRLLHAATGRRPASRYLPAMLLALLAGCGGHSSPSDAGTVSAEPAMLSRTCDQARSPQLACAGITDSYKSGTN